MKKKLLASITSNWLNFAVLLVASFIVSPILVRRLGNEAYGVWALIVSITGYFTVLDFGMNTAIVRYISKYIANNEEHLAREVYNTSFFMFFISSVVLFCFVSIFGLFLKDIFDIELFSQYYLYAVFLVIGVDFCFSLLSCVQLGALTAMQNFVGINSLNICFYVIKNVSIVIFILKGYSLLSLAFIQMSSNLAKYLCQYYLVRRDYKFLFFSKSCITKSTLNTIYEYSIYSFLIAISLKVLFYTNPIIIGSLINVSDVTFYSIPATILDYLEKLVWAVVVVFIPIISSFEAVGESGKNAQLYLIGTRYTLFLSLPFLVVLFVAGGDFIRLWMGPEYEVRSGAVLRILLLGYFFRLSQLMAQGILKGISRHKMLALFLCCEAVANLGLSILLAKRFGINGVAYGTIIPLVISNVLFIPMYTCRQLGISFLHYFKTCYLPGLLFAAGMSYGYSMLRITVDTYTDLFILGIVASIICLVYSYFGVLEKDHRDLLKSKFMNVIA